MLLEFPSGGSFASECSHSNGETIVAENSSRKLERLAKRETKSLAYVMWVALSAGNWLAISALASAPASGYQANGQPLAGNANRGCLPAAIH
jgi:hypothetical protein